MTSTDLVGTNISVKEAPITDVIVFSDGGCRTTRSVNIEPASTGIQKFIIKGITCMANMSSVRVAGKGSCTILEVNTECVSCLRSDFVEVDATRKEVEALIDQLKAIHRENEKLNHHLLIANEKKEAIRVFINTQLSSVPKGGFSEFRLSESESILKLLDVYTEAKTKINSEIDEIKENSDGLKLRYEILSNRLSELIGNSCPFEKELNNVVAQWQSFLESYCTTTVFVVTILMDVKQIEPIQLSLSYEVLGCSWMPSYDVRYFSNNNRLVIHYYGHITQRTEEDWTNVNLTISTARRERTKDIPKLPTEIVRFYQPPSHAVPLTRFDEVLTFSSRLSRESEVCSANACGTRVASSGITTAYHIEKRTTIKADGKAHKVGIAQLDFPSKPMRYAIPSLSKFVFLQTYGINNSEYQLIDSNEVSLFIDGAYVGKSVLGRTVVPGEKFYFSLGVDPEVILTHIPPRTHGKESGYISKSRHRAYDAVTHLKSIGSHPITIVVVFQYPTSADARITIKLAEPLSPLTIDEEDDPAGALTAIEKFNGTDSFFLNKTTNHLLHAVQLNPGSAKICRVRFDVEWPADQDILWF